MSYYQLTSFVFVSASPTNEQIARENHKHCSALSLKNNVECVQSLFLFETRVFRYTDMYFDRQLFKRKFRNIYYIDPRWRP
jgi:hypothetical protein